MPTHLESRSPDFSRLISDTEPLERVAGGFWFTEGPVWRGDHLLFSDIPNSRIVRWQELPEGPEVRTFRAPSNLTNGLTLDREGRLIACEGAARRLTRTEANGEIVVLAELFQGKRINAPNDVIVSSRGLIYFSDPFWAGGFANPHGARVRPEDRELGFAGVFRIDLDGALHAEADDFLVPNGLALSPDERILYVDDTRHSHIRAFDIQPDGSLANGRVLVEIEPGPRGVPDGMKVDREGNIYCTGPGGVWVIAPTGDILGRILLPVRPDETRPQVFVDGGIGSRLGMPEVAANVGWGGADWSTLYITATTSVYRIRTRIPGIPLPAR
jgi:sugar lactone lactonase YvrE